MDDYEILTPSGFQPFDGVRKTLHSSSVCVSFDDDSSIVCSRQHVFIDVDGDEVFASDAMAYRLKTDTGTKLVIDVCESNEEIELFDVLEVTGHVYFSDGLISHNCSFEGSAETLIDHAQLSQLTPADFTLHDNLPNFRVFETPIKENRYLVCADIALGVGGDYSAASVMDTTKIPYTQVAVFRDNTINTVQFAEVLCAIAREYNSAHVLLEKNIRGVGELMDREHHYPKILHTQMGGRAGQRVQFEGSSKTDYGVNMNVTTKAIGCRNLKMMCENRTIKINDAKTVEELFTFVKKEGSWAAESGSHDDLVMTLVLLGWLSGQEAWKEFVQLDARSIFMNTQKQRETGPEVVQSRFPIPGLYRIGSRFPDEQRVEKIGNEFWTVQPWNG